MISSGKSVSSPVSVYRDKSGTPIGILIQTFDDSFVIGLHDLKEDMDWDTAMREHRKELMDKKQWFIVAAYIEEIDDLLESVGGDRIKVDGKCYWSSVEFSTSNAWCYYGYKGALNGLNKYYRNSVRPLLAF